jgi:hypothetical protein
MAAVIVESASISIPLLGAGVDESAMVATPSIAGAVRESPRAMQHAVVSQRLIDGRIPDRTILKVGVLRSKKESRLHPIYAEVQYGFWP